MPRYEYWEHHEGEKYLIRLDAANLITGVCGPMRQADIPPANRHNFDFDAQPLRTVWVQTHVAEFHQIGLPGL
jgi:hypothetical protein